MKFTEPWGHQRLSFLLEKAASQEAKVWKLYVPKKPSSQDTDISPAQRDEAVLWLMELHSRLRLYPETLVLAVSILDRFLAPIKARPKYLRCITIACFFLAAKMCEEDERVPSLKELVASSSCACSPSEILRMERIVLDKLNWDLHTATALDFLHIFHAMVLSSREGFLESVLGLNRSQHLALLTQRLYHCLADHTLMQLRGSMLALALITLELETCCPDWLALTIDLLRRAQMDSSELIRSRELVARSLSTRKVSMPPKFVYIYQPLQRPAQEPALACCTLGTLATSSTKSSRDHALLATSSEKPLTPAGQEEESPPLWSSIIISPPTNDSGVPALLSPRNLLHPHPLQKVTLSCKASAKRKVDVMEVDDFYDGIKRLYNEDLTATVTVQEGAAPTSGGGGGGGGGRGGGEEGEGGGLNICSVLLSQQEGSSSPCPPLQPVSAS